MSGKSTQGQVRIIAGEWRSRRLPVADVPGLRPSGDRARETLFNWLQVYVAGARCADLFAGTGALGFEAASRGAETVTLVEQSPVAANQLQANIELLNAVQVRLVRGDACVWLKQQQAHSLDIIFADPPFERDAGPDVLAAIADSDCLKPGGFLYLESSALSPVSGHAAGLSVWRQKTIGNVCLTLFQKPAD